MVKWSNELYLEDAMKKNPKKWIKRVEKGKLTIPLYCICLASNDENLFDIMNCNEFLFHYYKQRDIYITGLARSREDAIDLLQDMIEDIYQKTGDIKVRDYFTF